MLIYGCTVFDYDHLLQYLSLGERILKDKGILIYPKILNIVSRFV